MKPVIPWRGGEICIMERQLLGDVRVQSHEGLGMQKWRGSNGQERAIKQDKQDEPDYGGFEKQAELFYSCFQSAMLSFEQRSGMLFKCNFSMYLQCPHSIKDGHAKNF